MYFSFLLHALLISLSNLLPWVWILNKSTQDYTPQLCGGILILYIVSKKILSNMYHEFNPNILTILTLSSVTQLLVFSTGGITSPLFFLYYFLIFAFALVYESRQAFTISLTTVLIYLFQSNFNLDNTSLISLISLLLISPLANIFSKTLISNLEAQGKIKTLSTEIEKEETDSLLWISTEAKPTLNSTISSITDLVIYLNSTRSNFQIPKSFMDKIKIIQSDLITLYSSSEDLEESIKESSDNK